MTKGCKFRRKRFSLQAYEELIEFHVTEAYFGLGLAKVQYSVSKLCSDEKEKVTLRINPSGLTA
jgi:hypothetical protein